METAESNLNTHKQRKSKFQKDKRDRDVVKEVCMELVNTVSLASTQPAHDGGALSLGKLDIQAAVADLRRGCGHKNSNSACCRCELTLKTLPHRCAEFSTKLEDLDRDERLQPNEKARSVLHLLHGLYHGRPVSSGVNTYLPTSRNQIFSEEFQKQQLKDAARPKKGDKRTLLRDLQKIRVDLDVLADGAVTVLFNFPKHREEAPKRRSNSTYSHPAATGTKRCKTIASWFVRIPTSKNNSKNEKPIAPILPRPVRIRSAITVTPITLDLLRLLHLPPVVAAVVAAV